MSYGEVIKNAYQGYADYLWNEITFQVSPWYTNYFWWLVALSLFVWGLEMLFPWRKNQSIFRKDFWLDTFYMFFNFFIFKLVFYSALAAITSRTFSDVLGANIELLGLLDLRSLPFWLQILIFFVAMDFVQWIVHNLLHKVPFFWQFHKVHHSVKEMGFAAHLRYHWMETIFYEPAKYLMLLFIGGFEPSSVFVVYYFNIAIGHLNHANIGWDYGPLKYILNNPKMHIWHHSKELPKGRHGVNFGLSLSIWDYIFRTAYIPKDGRDIELGFDGEEDFPKGFGGQVSYPLSK